MFHTRNELYIFRSVFTAALLLTTQLSVAWTNDTDTLPNINSLCKQEPEAQCTQAVRIGLEAPGVDWHESSMAQMRLDGANLQGANLSRSILHLSNLEKANLMLANLQEFLNGRSIILKKCSRPNRMLLFKTVSFLEQRYE